MSVKQEQMDHDAGEQHQERDKAGKKATLIKKIFSHI
jgi:hypothetical protein